MPETEAPEGVDPATGEVTDPEALADAQARERVPFAAFLQDHVRGALHGELTDGLAELVDAVRTFHEKGSMVLKIEVRPEGSDTVTVIGDVTLKPPTAPPEPAFYYTDESANLRKNDPRQMALPLREVPRQETTEPRKVAT